MNTPMKVSRCAGAALAALLLAACGQKGDLYLPDAEREVVPTAPASPQATPVPDVDDENADGATRPAGAADADADAGQ